MPSRPKAAAEAGNDRASPFAFEYLPLEIRLMIYSFLIVGADKIVTPGGEEQSFQMDVLVEGDKRRLRSSFQRPLQHDGPWSTEYGKIKRGKKRSCFTLDILLVSRDIYREVVGVLYGFSNFRFSRLHILRTFLTQIGDNKALIRSIKVFGKCVSVYGADSALGCAQLLTHATQLQHLCLDVGIRYGYYNGDVPSPHRIAYDFAAFIKSLWIRFNGDADKALKVITLNQTGKLVIDDFASIKTAEQYQAWPNPQASYADIFTRDAMRQMEKLAALAPSSALRHPTSGP